MLKEKRERAKRELGEKIISWKDRERAANEKIVLEEKKEITERAKHSRYLPRRVVLLSRALTGGA